MANCDLTFVVGKEGGRTRPVDRFGGFHPGPGCVDKPEAETKRMKGVQMRFGQEWK